MSQVSSSMSYNMEGRRILYRKDMRHGYWSSEETINFHSFSLQFFFFFLSWKLNANGTLVFFVFLKKLIFAEKSCFQFWG